MTATSETGGTPRYTLDNQWREARERLRNLELACDPYTAAHLDTVGVGPGWRCLEVGAGGGSVARMLAERVGADGHVLAVDLEPALLEDLAGPNLEVRRLNVVTDDLPEAEFDLIHTRAVLLHLAQRDEVLPKLVRALRPGGLVLFEEPDLTPTFQMDDIVQRTLEVMYRPVVKAGMDLFWAATLPEWIATGGLVDVGSVRERMSFTGQSPLAQFYRVTWQQFIETQPYTDDERAIMEEGRAAMSEPGGPYVAWDMVTAWGRRP